MADTNQINKNGLELIEGFELTVLHAYHGKADRQGVWTIGIGHVITGKEVPTLNPNNVPIAEVTITHQRAIELLQQDLITSRGIINKSLPQETLNELTDNAYAALVSFVFNIGAGGFKQSYVLQRLLNNQIIEAADSFKGFTGVRDSEGVLRRVNGLVRRRAAERALYLSDLNKMQFYLTNSGPTAIEDAKRYIGLS